MAQERELSTSVDTLAQTEQALKRLDSLETNAQVSVFQTHCPYSFYLIQLYLYSIKSFTLQA